VDERACARSTVAQGKNPSAPSIRRSVDPPDDERVSMPSHATDEERTMKYLCMVYYDEKRLDALTPAQQEALVAESLGYEDELRESGHVVVAHALEPVAAAATVRSRQGGVSVSDAPCAETKEQLGGFILVEARDLNEAIHLASRVPAARLGGVEVRPVREAGRRC
jgi:hypothetical protein